MQEWLLKTAVLDRFCPQLCDALCGSTETQLDGSAFIEHLTNNHLFVIALDKEQTWYRYHHLFEQFLRQVAVQRYSPSAINQFHSQAAKWLAHHHFLEESLHHAIIAKDFDAAAQVVADHARTLLDNDQWHILEVWLAQLPDEQIQQRPTLLLAKAWIAFHQFALWTIPPILDKIESTLEKDDEAKRPLSGEVDFFWGHHWYWQGQQKRSLRRFNQALAQIPKTHHLARGEAELFWGLSMQMAGKKSEAIQQINQWLYYESSIHPGRQTKLIGALIFIHYLANELTAATLITEQLYDLASKAKNIYVKSWSAYLLGQFHFHQHDIEKATFYFQEAAQSRYVLHKAAAIDTLIGLAFCYQSSAQYAKAEAAMSDLQELAWQTNNPAYMTIARSAHARLALLRDDPLQAKRYLQSADLSTDAGILFYWLETPRLTQCRVLIAQETPECFADAQAKLKVHEQSATANHNQLKMVEILLLQTVVYQAQKFTDKAMKTLNKAVKLAHVGNNIRPFIEAGPQLLPLMSQLSTNDAAVSFIQTIQKAVADYHQMPQPSQSLAEILTYRESEILALLAQQMSNQEIATELTISLHTVKRHTSAIYRKLAVKNRRQAVAKAQKAGLLSTE